MVVTGLVVTLQPSMTVEEEVKLIGMADATVLFRQFPAMSPLPPRREQAGGVPLLHHHSASSLVKPGAQQPC